MANPLKTAAARLDSWINAITGIGTQRDKLAAFRFQRRLGVMDPEALEGLYHEDDAAARICDAAPEHMLRPWIGIQVSDPTLEAGGISGADVETKTLALLDDLKARDAFLSALVWERLFGGSVILVGADDGRPVAEPLDLDAIAEVRFLTVLDRRDVIPWTWYTDPQASKYGEPETYKILRTWNPGMRAKREAERIPPAEILVHASRLIVFPGLRTSRRKAQENNGWGLSELERAYNALQAYNANWGAVGNILQDASQGVFKVQGLVDMIASGNKQALLERLELVDVSRSVARSLLLDAETESFERRDTTMSGLPDLLDRTMLRLAAAARMPVAVLMGREPAGLNATGESDIRNWYDTLDAERNHRLRPRLDRLLRILFRAKKGPTGGVEPSSWNVRFPPLWQPTPKELADIRKVQADTDAVRISSGVLSAEEVALARFRPEGYSDEIDGIDLEARSLAVEAYQEKLATGEGDLGALPPPPEPDEPPVPPAAPPAPPKRPGV